MIAELGVLALILALICALLLVIVPLCGLYTQKDDLCKAAFVYVWGQWIWLVVAYACLTWCFLHNDFTVGYVLANSSELLPWFYKMCAVWGGHEGSMLLWVVVLSNWTLSFLLFSRSLDAMMRVRVLIVLGALSVGFILFLLITSNPFLRQFDVLHASGRDLNPLLQDLGFLFHPPTLYMGYVGFSVAFAFAISALWLGRFDTTWVPWVRPWTLAAWCYLTAGITLGSWWAYRELGWGGWWFWDPVENASFMPWLVGTAFIHACIVSEKRPSLVSWTFLLAIAGFSLSLVGTFLVRSGVLTSVHAFAVDPARGLYILLFLLLVIGGSLLLFAVRARQMKSYAHPFWLSRESLLLLNYIFLMAAMGTVLLGTLYPLIIDSLDLGKLSVGAPYFNAVFVPLTLPLLFLMGLGIHVRWQKDDLMRLVKRLRWVFLLCFVGPLAMSCGGAHDVSLPVIFGVFLSLWVIFSTLYSLYQRLSTSGWRAVRPAWCGMILAHLGVAMTVLGISISTGYGVHRDVTLTPGETTDLAGFHIQFVREMPLHGPNYHGTRAMFRMYNTRFERFIYPEKRLYNVGHMAMTESAIDVTPFRDFYIALGEPLDNKTWTVRLYYKPLVRWIWSGGFLMVIGGLCALFERRKVT